MQEIQSQNKDYFMGIDEYMKMVGREEGIEIGMEKGLEKGRRVFVENLLTATQFSDEKIASLADVPVEFVDEVKTGLKAN